MTVVTTYNSVEEQAIIGEAASAVLLYNTQTVEPEMKICYVMAAKEITFLEILINLFVMVHAAVVICVNQFVLHVLCVLNNKYM